jgi:ribosome-associated protein
VQLAHRIVDLAEDKQGSDIVLLDIRTQSTIADYFVICSAENDRQLKAIVENIDETIQTEFGVDPRIEGMPMNGWIILDYDDVVAHIFRVDMREYYQLERLWNKVPPLVVVQ